MSTFISKQLLSTYNQHFQSMKQNNYCRFGSNCRKNQQGNCNFKHRGDQTNHKNQRTSTSKGYPRQRERSRSAEREKDNKKYRDQRNKNQDYKRRQQSQSRREEVEFKRQVSKPRYEDRPKYRQRLNDSPHNPNQPNTQSNTKPFQRTWNRPNSPNTPNTSSIPYQREFSNFCKSYHLQNICDNKDNCTKIHGFMFKNHDRIRRRVFKKSDKFTKDVKLCCSINEQTINYVVKSGKEVIFYKYTPAINDLKEIDVNTVQNSKSPKNQYFGCEGATFYFSFINEDSFSDLVCFNFSTKDYFQIKNAHLKDVTGMTPLNPQKIISASLDGTIKVWTFDREKLKLVYNHETSLQFKNHYNPQDKKLQLHFIYKTIWGDKELICIGTGDSKLLIFVNQTPISFMEIVISQIQSKIVKIKQINKNNEPFQILVLAQGKDKSCIYRLTIDGVKENKTEKLVELENREGKRITTFEKHQELLFVSYDNQIIIYDLTDKVRAVGGILHTHPIKSLTITECYLKTTDLSIFVLAVLQGASEDKQQGVLSFYFLK